METTLDKETTTKAATVKEADKEAATKEAATKEAADIEYYGDSGLPPPSPILCRSNAYYSK